MSGQAGDRLFFTHASSPSDTNDASGQESSGGKRKQPIDHSEEYMLGVMVGLACYNGVLVNLPLVDIVYKLFNNGQVR